MCPRRRRRSASLALRGQLVPDQVDRPLHRLVDDALRRLGVAGLARLVEAAVVPDRAAKPLLGREHDAVVALGPPEEPLDLGDQARAAGGLVAGRMERPARAEVAVAGRLAAEALELTEAAPHPLDLGGAGGGGAEAGRKPLEAEPRGGGFLEVLAAPPGGPP